MKLKIKGKTYVWSLDRLLEGPIGMIATVVLGITYVYLCTGLFGGY